MPKIKSEYDDLDKYDFYGSISYYKKNTYIIHNPYGPAIIGIYGEVEYCIDHKWHRLDGPARIWVGGYEEYYINGKRLSKEEFEIHPERLKFLGKQYLICLI